MQHGGSGGGGRYNRTSLNRHDEHTKREPWDYRKPKRRKPRPFVHIRRYARIGKRWVLREDV